MGDRRVEDRLRSLGLMGNHKGYHCLVYSVHLIQQDPSYIELATKRLYPEVARCFDMNLGSVDSAMRTAVQICCTRCGAQVAAMCGGITHPTVSEFLRSLVATLS